MVARESGAHGGGGGSPIGDCREQHPLSPLLNNFFFTAAASRLESDDQM